MDVVAPPLLAVLRVVELEQPDPRRCSSGRHGKVDDAAPELEPLPPGWPRRADVGTIESFYDANIMLCRPRAPFRFWDPRRPIYTHLRHLPGARLTDCRIKQSIVDDGCFLDCCEVEETVVGIRTNIRGGSRVTRSVLLGADYYEDSSAQRDVPALGIGKNVVLDRVIVDKNARIGDGARLVNEAGVTQADGDGYYIRGGLIIVPKGGVIRPGTVV